MKTLVQRLHATGRSGRRSGGVLLRAARFEEEYGRYATHRLIDKLYQGSAKNLVAALVDSGLSGEDVAELREMLRKEGEDA